uniref:Uncharacterized protein n=1 Tax=Glossina brevipalpis TaxID=37001 RepID=A0A1A9WL46_9MUSC
MCKPWRINVKSIVRKENFVYSDNLTSLIKNGKCKMCKNALIGMCVLDLQHINTFGNRLGTTIVSGLSLQMLKNENVMFYLNYCGGRKELETMTYLYWCCYCGCGVVALGFVAIDVAAIGVVVIDAVDIGVVLCLHLSMDA